MSGRKKVIRTLITILCVYIILNVLVWGIMTAYMNTRNILNEDKLTMAEITEKNEQTSITILGRQYSLSIENSAENTAKTIIYCMAPCKIRACAELLTQAEKYFME